MKGRPFIPLVLAALLCCCDDTPPPPPATAAAEPRPTALVESPAFSGDNAYVHCAAICSRGPRYSGSPAYAAQLDYLEQQLHAAGWQTFRDSFSAPNGTPMVNLRATFGTGQHTRPVLVSSHIDTKVNIAKDFVSADDGPSGAAVMLESARLLAQSPATAEQVELIFLDGEESFARRMTEEDGLYGSKYDVRRRAGKLPRYQVNLDMVGGRNNIIAIPAVDTSQHMFSLYQAVIRELGLSFDQWTAYPGSYMDDHQPYLDAGVDSLNLIALFGQGDWWHTPKDNMDRISPRKLGESGRVLMALLSRLTQVMQGTTPQSGVPL